MRLVDACIRYQDHFSGGAGMELLQIWGKHAPLYVSNQVCDMQGHMAKGSLGQAYIEKNPLAALQAFAIASGWEQSSLMRHHFLGGALVRTIAYKSI